MTHFTNNNAIHELVHPYTPIEVTESFEGIEDPVIFDSLNPPFTFTQDQLETVRPEWKDTILPLIVKAKTEGQYRHTDCFLFGTTTWYHVTYQEGTFHFNQAKPKQKRFRSHDLLFATVPPHWNARYTILKLLQPAQLAKTIEESVQRSTADLHQYLCLGQPLSYPTLEWNVASKLTEL